MHCVAILVLFSTVNSAYSASQIFAQPGQAPYQVAIFLHGKFLCNGALARHKQKHQIILTSGFCMTNRNEGDTVRSPVGMEILAGVHDITNLTDAKRQHVTEVIRHPKWLRGGLYNDIAILRIPNDFTHQHGINTIQIPEVENWHPKSGTEVECSAWGYSSIAEEGPGNIHPIKKLVDLEYVSAEDCQKKYPGVLDKDTQFCVGTKHGTVGKPDEALLGVCYGDFGGTLILLHEKPEGHHLFGIFSWAQPGCGRQKEYAKYAKVDAFLKFIIDEAYNGNWEKN